MLFPVVVPGRRNRVIMSMQPRPWPEVPEETARVARAAFRKAGSLRIRIRDELGSWYEDGNFAAVYPVRGAPGISPAQLAMVTVLQFCENLTDRQAADEARGRVDRKYCLGLELADEGFEFTVLNGFRDRLLAGGAAAAADLDPAVLPGRGEGGPAEGARARPPAGQRPPGLPV